MPGMISLGWRMWRAGYNPAEIVNLLELRQALEGCSTVLDVGCGPTSRLRHFGFRHLAGIEGYLPSLEAARKNGTHHELVQGEAQRSIERINFMPSSLVRCSMTSRATQASNCPA